MALEARRACLLSRRHVLHATENSEAVVEVLTRLAYSAVKFVSPSLSLTGAITGGICRRQRLTDLVFSALEPEPGGFSFFAGASARCDGGSYCPPALGQLRGQLADNLGLGLEQVRIERKGSPHWGDHLQIADALAWAYYRRLTHGDPRYAALVTSLVTLEIVGVDAQGSIRPVGDMGGAIS